MTKEDLKSMSVEVSKLCWQDLKVIAIRKGTSLSSLTREILENSVKNKKYESLLGIHTQEVGAL